MNIKEMVGKKAIRTAPINYGNGCKDYSYTEEGLLILNVTNNHIVVENTEGGILKNRRHILDSRWIDDNWEDYDELMRIADEVKKCVMPVETSEFIQ